MWLSRLFNYAEHFCHLDCFTILCINWVHINLFSYFTFIVIASHNSPPLDSYRELSCFCLLDLWLVPVSTTLISSIAAGVDITLIMLTLLDKSLQLQWYNALFCLASSIAHHLCQMFAVSRLICVRIFLVKYICMAWWNFGSSIILLKQATLIAII